MKKETNTKTNTKTNTTWLQKQQAFVLRLTNKLRFEKDTKKKEEITSLIWDVATQIQHQKRKEGLV